VSTLHKFVTYLPTYLQPWHSHKAKDLSNSNRVTPQWRCQMQVG